jgi:acetyltransferase EpsM
MGKKIIILGGVGNGSVIANAIVDANRRGDQEWEFAGYLNDRIPVGEHIESFPVLGALADWAKFGRENYRFINTIYRIDGQRERIHLFESLNIPDERLATFIHPLAYAAPNARLGPGTVLMPFAALSWRARPCFITPLWANIATLPPSVASGPICVSPTARISA